ncbi:MAG: GNAT family N-acetyltransferase [Thermoanaerobaculia bacterium]
MTEPGPPIRRAGPADAAALADFAARVFDETFGPDNRPEDMAAHLANRFGVRQQTEEILDPAIVTLLMEEDGRLIAYTQVTTLHPAPPCVTGEAPVEIGRFYVDRSWHGRGLAQRLMDAARDAARGLGGRTAWLAVWERNPRAIAFYERQGFRDVGSQPFLLGADLQTDRVMMAAL